MEVSSKNPVEENIHDVDDELAAVKAAAWAWFQHGSGSEGNGKSIQEFDHANYATQRPIRPSRFKIEAMRHANEISSGDESEASSSSLVSSPTHTDTTSLFDAYEIARISQHLDCLIETKLQRGPSRKGRLGNSWMHGCGDTLVDMNEKKLRKKLNPLSWLSYHRSSWLSYGGICRSTDDVVETRSFVVSRPPRANQ
ncbi:hypothetical protein MKW98_014122 [Papaver atlanticum]|uniref:Uncharacterized protein n=1 Tax=Papaver atlanticum TaxID=357466 RepID=A0AAD4SJA9_9MAGN|nr:hypothetical protein MKW98_014122 [Papaver atlanticum]